MARRSATASASRNARHACVHHWQVEHPSSQYSQGKCGKCGATRRFLNYGEELRMPFGRRRKY